MEENKERTKRTFIIILIIICVGLIIFILTKLTYKKEIIKENTCNIKGCLCLGIIAKTEIGESVIYDCAGLELCVDKGRC